MQYVTCCVPELHAESRFNYAISPNKTPALAGCGNREWFRESRRPGRGFPGRVSPISARISAAGQGTAGRSR